jgi:hypothetical protein
MKTLILEGFNLNKRLDYSMNTNPNWKLWMSALIVISILAAFGALFYQHKHSNSKAHLKGTNTLEQVKTTAKIKDNYDVIVVGTDPEGIAAAVSAARNGLSTLLVDGKNREILGGLMTLGWLNTIDMNRTPDQHDVFNKGIFSEWFGKIEGDSFDVITAANAFKELVKNEKNIDLLLKTREIKPLTASASNGNGNMVMQGIQIVKEDGSKQTITAKSVIDATQDADLAAAAGVPFTYGREDLGDPGAKMAVTLVFRLKNITPEVWKQIQSRLNGDNNPDTGANEVSAWGYGEMYSYPEVNIGKVKMRGLNIGRQSNNTMLINALQIFGINGLDPQSREEAMTIGKNEIVHVVDYMKQHFPEFANIELDSTAPELYVRETRHIQGEYRLHILDVLENKDQWDRIAFGSYPVDIQRLAPTDSGAVMGKPMQYAVPFRSIVPLKVDRLLVVGRSASYDTLPHGSARVIPTGMAEGEAAGAAAKLAQEKNITFQQLAASKDDVAQLQERLNQQGMVLKPFSINPQPFMLHKEYAGLKTAISLALTSGGHKNDFHLDDPANPKSMANLVRSAHIMLPSAFKGDADAAIAGLPDPAKAFLTLEQASYTITQALGISALPAQAAEMLLKQKLLSQESLDLFSNKQKLTYGDTYTMIKDLKIGLTGNP